MGRVRCVFTPSQDGIARRLARVPAFYFVSLLNFTVAGEEGVHLGAARDAAQNAVQF